MIGGAIIGAVMVIGASWMLVLVIRDMRRDKREALAYRERMDRLLAREQQLRWLAEGYFRRARRIEKRRPRGRR